MNDGNDPCDVGKQNLIFMYWYYTMLISGVDVIPWMGKLSNLGPATQLPVNPYGPSDTSSPFPLKVQYCKCLTLSTSTQYIYDYSQFL